MPVIEQIAIMAQLVGQKISDLNPVLYSSPDVLQSVALNITAGNKMRGGPAVNGQVGRG
jgi:hypothetical protein